MHYQRGDRNETSSNTFDVLQAHHIGEVAVGQSTVTGHLGSYLALTTYDFRIFASERHLV